MQPTLLLQTLQRLVSQANDFHLLLIFGIVFLLKCKQRLIEVRSKYVQRKGHDFTFQDSSFVNTVYRWIRVYPLPW